MDNQVYTHELCPNCGHDKVEIDWQYGEELRRRTFNKRALNAFLVWIVAALFGPGFDQNQRFPPMFYLIFAVAGFTLVLILVILAHRQVYGSSNASEYPDTKYTCLRCEHWWTSEDARMPEVPKTDEPEAGADIEPQAVEDLPTEAQEEPEIRRYLIAISYILALLVNARVILIADSIICPGCWTVLSPRLVIFMPASVVILAFCAHQGKLYAKKHGISPWVGASIGVWIGAIVSIVFTLFLIDEIEVMQ